MAKVVGPWEESEAQTSLVSRCRDAWEKPFAELSRLEIATFLGQRLAVEHLLPFGKKKIEATVDDDSEWYDGHLARSIEEAECWVERDQKHRQTIATRYDSEQSKV